jgi:hypothetical protein
MPVITLFISGPTRIRPVYRVEYLPEVVVGEVKHVVKSVVIFDRAGRPMTDIYDVPAYAKVAYEVRRVVAWDIPGNSSSAEVREGEAVVLRAPPELDFGDGTKLVFRQWSTGDESLAITVGPGRYAALYDVYYLVSFRATNYTYSQWVPRGSRVSPPDVRKVFDNGTVRILVTGWTAPDGKQARFPYTVNATAGFIATERVEYFATVVDWDTKTSGWYPRGHRLPTPERRYILWQFARWEPGPVIDAPGTYTATYQIDPAALAMLLLATIAVAAAVIAYRRR